MNKTHPIRLFSFSSVIPHSSSFLIVHIVRDAAIRKFFLTRTVVLNSCKAKCRIYRMLSFAMSMRAKRETNAERFGLLVGDAERRTKARREETP
jgi:hypothetical protein